MLKRKLRFALSAAVCATLLFSASFGVTAFAATPSPYGDPILSDSEPFVSPPKSEALLKYESLLAFRSPGEIIAAFEELYGDLSPAFILENAETLFGTDTPDEGILAVLTSDELRGTPPGADDPLAATGWVMSAEEVRALEAEEDLTFEDIFGEIPEPELPQPEFSEEVPDEILPSPGEPIRRPGGALRAASASAAFVSIDYVSKTNTSVTFDIWYVNNSSTNNILQVYDTGSRTWSYLLGRDGKPAATARRYTATGLKAGGVYQFVVQTYDWGTEAWKSDNILIQTTGAKTPAVTVSDIGTTSVKVTVTYPSEGVWGNQLQIYHWLPDEWTDVTGLGNYATSKTYTVSGLTPGERYEIYFRYYDHLRSLWPATTAMTRKEFRTELPAENLLSYSKSKLNFKLDKVFVDIMNQSPGRLDRFMTKMNAAYAHMQTLAGAVPYGGAAIGIHASRNLPLELEGTAGNPIYWATTGLYYGSPSHALRMNQKNADLTETPFHELGHDFTSWKWDFEPEALANFFAYYYFSQSGETFAVANQTVAFSGGTGYKLYIKSYVNRLMGECSRDEALANDVYSPYLLTYRLADIVEQTGWEPVKQTFRYMDTLPQAPTSRIEKFNLFVSKLKELSGKDVIAMIPTVKQAGQARSERQIIEAKLGGAIRYVDRKAVVVLPGIMGTRLKYGSTQVWEPGTVQGVLGTWSPYLYCDENGNSVSAITPVNDNQGAQNIYANLVSALRTRYEPNGYDVLFFGYDWRLGCGTNAASLSGTLSNYDEVYLVAHSMGGLVASSYIAASDANRNKVKLLVTLGTPYAGSVKSIRTLETGVALDDGLRDFFLSPAVRYVASNFASIHQLIPTATHSGTLVRLETSVGTTSTVSYDYAAARTFLSGRDWAQNSTGGVKGIFTNAPDFHHSLVSGGMHAANRVDHVYVVGTGQSTPTTAVYLLYPRAGYEFSHFIYAPGDGTVLTGSASNGSGRYASFALDHTGLAQGDSVITKVKSWLDAAMTGQFSAQTASLNVVPSEEEDYHHTIIVAGGAGDVCVTDAAGNAAFEDGEALFIQNASGQAEEIASVWMINPETNRKQFNFYADGYTVSLNDPVGDDAPLEVLAIRYHNGEYESFQRYMDFGGADNACVVTTPDDICVTSLIDGVTVLMEPMTD